MRTVDYKQYKKKYKLLHSYGVNRSELYRWVVDLAIVRLATSGKVSLEKLNEEGIDFDTTLNNAKVDRTCIRSETQNIEDVLR